MGAARPWSRKLWRKLLLLNLLNMTEVGATLVAYFYNVVLKFHHRNITASLLISFLVLFKVMGSHEAEINNFEKNQL